MPLLSIGRAIIGLRRLPYQCELVLLVTLVILVVVDPRHVRHLPLEPLALLHAFLVLPYVLVPLFPERMIFILNLLRLLDAHLSEGLPLLYPVLIVLQLLLQQTNLVLIHLILIVIVS